MHHQHAPQVTHNAGPRTQVSPGSYCKLTTREVNDHPSRLQRPPAGLRPRTTPRTQHATGGRTASERRRRGRRGADRRGIRSNKPSGKPRGRTSSGSLSLTRGASEDATAKRVIGYCRVSTPGQARNGESIADQRERIAAHCTAHRLTLIEVIEDGGFSASTLKRPGVKRLLSMVKGREVDAVVVLKLDRLTRSLRDLGDLVKLFERTGVALVSVSESIDTGTAAGRMVLNILGTVSQWQREYIAERTAEVLVHKRKKGQRVSRFAPYGYRETPDGKRWVQDPVEQRGIALMLELRADGHSYRDIGTILYRKGYRGRKGQKLAGKTVARALRALD